MTSAFQCSLDPHLEKLDFLRAANSLEFKKSLKSAAGMGYLVISRFEVGLCRAVLVSSLGTKKLAHKELTKFGKEREVCYAESVPDGRNSQTHSKVVVEVTKVLKSTHKVLRVGNVQVKCKLELF